MDKDVRDEPEKIKPLTYNTAFALLFYSIRLIYEKIN